MTGGSRTLTNDDGLIPEPVYFARKLGWTKGWGKAWSWWRLCEVAGESYWANRPDGRKVVDAA